MHFILPAPHLPSPRPHAGVRRAGFTMVEMLMVMGVIALLVSVSVTAPGLLTTTKSNTTLMQMTTMLDSTRAKALGGMGTVWFVVAGANAPAPLQPFKAYVICTEEIPAAGGPGVLVPLSPWEKLPDGLVFTATAPASATAGENLLSIAPGNINRPVRLATVGASADPVLLPCIGFGSLGEVISPVNSAGPVLVAIAEGDVSGGKTVTFKGGAHEPAKCRWIAIHRNTGKVVQLP